MKCLIIFTRPPRSGQTKTRLIPALGAVGAANLQARLTRLLLHRVRVLDKAITVRIDVDNLDLPAARKWLGRRFDYAPQANGDIGRRMAHAFDRAFSAGAQQVVLVGSDIPDVTDSVITRAFDQLTRHDMTLGPAVDGGYYLVGMRRLAAVAGAMDIFAADMPWGTCRVFDQTLAIAGARHLSIGRLPMLRDIDRPADLVYWKKLSSRPSVCAAGSRISVIIPTLNEQHRVGMAIDSLNTAVDIDILVADGGSADATAAIAARHGARVCHAIAGRARQMNAGARRARGDILLFLHADTRLPSDWDYQVRCALGDRAVIAGAFSLGIDAPARKYRWIETAANRRSRWLKLPYGDQAFFLRRQDFLKTGGYARLPIMEDFELMRRLGRQGRVVTLESQAMTSARRWDKLGALRTTLVNQKMVLGYLLGISPKTLTRWYRFSEDRG